MERSKLFAMVAAVLSIGLLTEAQAAPDLKAHAFTSSGSNNGASFSATGPLTRSTTGNNSIGTGASRSSADFGILRNYAQATAIADYSNNLFMSTNEAYFADDLTIDAPGLTGTSGTLIVKFTIDGTLSATQPQVDPNYSQTYASASYYLSRLGYGLIQTAHESLYADGTREYDTSGAFLNLEQTANVPFTFGSPFTLRLTVTTGVGAYTRFGGAAIADLEHTAEWGGFAAVQNGSGEPVLGYSAFSSTGVNYVNAIPEPTAGLLMVAGLAGSMVLGRSRGKDAA